MKRRIFIALGFIGGLLLILYGWHDVKENWIPERRTFFERARAK